MSKDKYLSTFSPQMKVIVFIILEIVYARRAIWQLGNIHAERAYIELWVYAESLKSTIDSHTETNKGH